MKKLLTFLCLMCVLYSCNEGDLFSDGNEDAIYDAPCVRSYTTYISQNSVTLNGFIDYENIVFQEPDTYTVGFIFRGGNAQDSSNDQVIELEEEVAYYNGFYNYSHAFDGLTPNTTY